MADKSGDTVMEPKMLSLVKCATVERERKRRRDDKPNQPRKYAKARYQKNYLKSSDNNQSVARKFTDLPMDCLEHIFDHLDFKDLLNVVGLTAQAADFTKNTGQSIDLTKNTGEAVDSAENTTAQAVDITKNTAQSADFTENAAQAAYVVFNRRYSKHLIKMVGLETPETVQLGDSMITISEPSICLKLLDHFGISVKKLQLEYLSNELLSGKWSEIPNLINKKCSSTLEDIKVINCDEKLFDGIKQEFAQVLNLRISCSRLGKCMELGKWFPNLNRLELVHNDRCVQIVSNVPHLSYLAMDTKHSCLSTSNIQTMIKSAPQLQTLSLSGGLDGDLLRFINENSPNLKQLFLWDFHLENNQSGDKIKFKTIETLSISTGMLGFLPNDIPFEFEQLTELRLIADMLDDVWIDFTIEHQNLIKLKLHSILEPEFGDDQMADLANALPKLAELDVVANITPDDLAEFLINCKSLKKIRIKKFGRTNYDRYQQLAGRVWSTVLNEQGLTFERIET